MIANLTDWFAAELGLPASPGGEAYQRLDAGAEFMEPDRSEFRSQAHRHKLGQSAFLSSYKLLDIPMSLFAGWVQEFNDNTEAAIALRRQTARGA